MTRAGLFFGLAVAVFVVALTLAAVGMSATSTPGSAAGRSSPPIALASVNEADLAARVGDDYGALPLYFEPNQGQVDAPVAFLARSRGYTLFLTAREAVLSPRAGGGVSSPVRMSFLGADPAPRVTGLEKMPGQSNYLVACMAPSSVEIPHFGKVRYERIYAGIDLVFYGNQDHLEFDFVVAPNADPRLIRLGFSGADSISMDGDGELLVETESGAFVQHAPVIYQEIDGVRRGVQGGYQMDGSAEISFSIDEYDRTLPLVIDPMLSYSTFLGSDGGDEPHGIAVDSSGHAYITGDVDFTSFPTTGPNIGFTGGSMILVTKLNAAGNGLVYSTFIGGCMGSESGYGIAVDAGGNAYVTGGTDSVDFPTLFSPQDTLNGPADAFLLKLNPAGSALVYSTYFGGGSTDTGVDVAVDSTNKAYVTGKTSSSDFPTGSAQQGTFGGTGDGFVFKLSSGAGVQYSTFLGGSGTDAGWDIAVDKVGSAYVTGKTESSDFPTLNAMQGTIAGAVTNDDAFVSKLAADGTLRYSTFLGGSSSDEGLGIDVDSGGSVYVAGHTYSADFPTVNAFDGSLGGTGYCAKFVTKLNNAGGGPVYSTYFDGVNSCGFNTDIAVDAQGRAHVVGWTASNGFPTVRPIDGAKGGFEDGFASRFTANGQALEFSTYLGGTSNDDSRNVALGPDGNTYVLGFTWSSDFPTVNAFQPDRKLGGDMFVAKITDPLDFFIAGAPAARENEVAAAAAAAAEELLAREQ